jgi:catechol 2,3-dioxygenase
MAGTIDTNGTDGLAPLSRSADPIAPGVEIGHVHLKAADLERIRAFYVGVLGFDVVIDLPDALFVSAGGYHHHLGFNTWESRGGSPPPHGTTGLYHVAIRYPTRAALGDALRRLVEARWPIDGATDHGTHEAIYLRDPEQNGLELAWDRPRDQWPRDAGGHLGFVHERVDLQSLLDEAARA